MKTLLLMRHAKSSWANEGQPDHQRPLNARGQRDAPRMGRWIQQSGYLPQVLLSSDSTRTRETAALLLPELSPAPRFEFLETLYHADVSILVRVAQETDSEVNSLMLLAHNPGMEELISSLRGRHEALPTSGLAIFELEILGWDTFHAAAPAKLVAEIKPRDLEQ